MDDIAVAVAQSAQNAKLELTNIALGTGKYTPNYWRTALVGYKERAAPFKACRHPCFERRHTAAAGALHTFSSASNFLRSEPK